ncbi:MAG: hypothetical protein WA424_09330 [Candidatus Sulfotelmatobacter sp.]
MNAKKVEDRNSVLARIVGARLTSVDFVMDYLILGFDGKGALTTLVWPEIFTDGSILAFGMQGYRDQLCELITTPVLEAQCSKDQTITISFEHNRLRIPLRDRRVSGERAIFTYSKHGLFVWSKGP